MDDETISRVAAARRAEIEAIPIAPDITDYLLDRFERYADEQALNFFEDGTSLTYGPSARSCIQSRGPWHKERHARCPDAPQ